MTRCSLQTRVGETGGRSDPSGMEPQLLDGGVSWPPAKRNVYTNMHNCSERGHGELTIRRKGSRAPR